MMAKTRAGSLPPASRPRITEKAFQAQVVQLAKLLGWAVYHTFDSRHSAAGFPDLVLARERVIFAELKLEHRKLTQAQEAWLNLLERAGAETYVVKPSRLESFGQVLRRRA